MLLGIGVPNFEEATPHDDWRATSFIGVDVGFVSSIDVVGGEWVGGGARKRVTRNRRRIA